MKNNPMQGIKYGLAFAFGALYASCWWITLSFWDPNAPRLILPIVGIIAGSVLMILGVLFFVTDHW